MVMNATDISLVFLGILIIMVLLEVRKLSRKPEPVSRLEEQFERLSQQMERIRPGDLNLPGGAQLVETHHSFETISEQLERLGESTEELDTALLTEAGAQRFTRALNKLRDELATAQELFDSTARGLGQASESMAAARAALQRLDAHLENVLAPTARRHADGGLAAKRPPAGMSAPTEKNAPEEKRGPADKRGPEKTGPTGEQAAPRRSDREDLDGAN